MVSTIALRYNVDVTSRKAKPASSVADLRTRIRGAGLRSTPARLAVLKALELRTTPSTHADLAAELVPQGFDKATVYRNLIDLTDAGMLSRSELGDHVWRFELRRGAGGHTGEHPHFLCVDCGEVACLSNVDVNISTTAGKKKSAGLGKVTEVLLKGHCDRCSR
ncbi:MAG: transcriptional repressor [Planctomycetaceae bacterium]|nr:transcriptional repressor [Planctomycetaceae bacterium]